MNGLVAPKPAAAALPRWTRPAEFLVYLVPVGTISTELYEGYVRLLQTHSVLAIRALTRPGGYAAELSPFRSFAWDGTGAIRFRFVSTTDKIDTFDGEDVHACARAVGVLGICHCPTTPSLSVAYQQFMDSIRHFPGLLVQKCFAFEHQFDLRTVEECAALSHLVMFPVYHELDSNGNGDGSGSGLPHESDSSLGGGAVMSTVSLHLQVVLDTLCVTILMSLESTVRAAVRQQQTQPTAPAAAIEMGDAAGFLLDTNVEPATSAQLGHPHQPMQQASALSPFPLRETLPSGGSSPSARSLPSTPTTDRASSAAAAAGGGGVSSLFVSAETRNRKRHLARQRKLFGDYAVLLNCLPDAIEHYVSAMELLRDEERKSGGAPGDTLWLAAALEGYVFCLYQQCQDKFVVEIVEKASEAVALYAKAGVHELEISLVENIGSYYTAVAVQLSSQKGMEKVEEATWVKRLLWEIIERGVAVFPEVPIQRQVQFLVQSASMLEAVGHYRRMSLYLHEAVTLLAQKWRPTNGFLVTSPWSQTSHPHQRAQELRVALRLELITAQRLGMGDRIRWEVTSLRRRTRRLRRQQRQHHHKKPQRVTLPIAIQEMEPWLVLRFHVLRQLISVAKMLADPFLVGRHCIQLLQVLSWCDKISYTSSTEGISAVQFQVDQPQTPFSVINTRSTPSGGFRAGLHSRGSGASGSGTYIQGVYATPPASIEVKGKRYFNMSSSPSATMSSAAATITSTIANTPRTLLATPRQQISAAVSAISTKATPAFSSFSNSHPSVMSASTPPSTSLNNRTSSATAAELMNAANGGVVLGVNGARSSAFDSDTPKANSQSDTLINVTNSCVDGIPTPVWNLSSRQDIQLLQRRVLGILEAECAVMRPTEQLKLDSFVQVNKINILHDMHRHPLLKREVALAKCGVSGASTDEASDGQAPAFFYNPFDKNKPSSFQKVPRTSPLCETDSEEDEDGGNSTSTDGFERCFPVHERVPIQVTLSNPYGIELDLQQVSIWIETAPELSNRLSSTSPSSNVVEAYPSSLILKPYERHKRIVLAVRGLRTGVFHVCGCFIKLLNIKTSFRMKTPLILDIVEASPRLSLSLTEIGSLREESSNEESMNPERDGVLEVNAPNAAAITDPICMFANETKRCILHVQNTGHCAVQSMHATVRAGKAGMSLDIARSKTVFTSFRHGMVECPVTFETENISFRCLASRESLAALLPLERGDRMAIPFEVSLRSLQKRAAEDRHEQLQWTFIYGHGDGLTETQTIPRSYFRQSQQNVSLVALSSLQVHSVQVLPKSDGVLPSALDVTDHENCIVIIEVANPTETVFSLRVLMRDTSCKEKGNHVDNSSGDEAWDVEIGRQSSRSLVIEVPRSEMSEVLGQSPADILNKRLVLSWKTYFGTVGGLLFHDSLWTEKEQDVAIAQLTRPDILFGIEAADEMEVVDGDKKVANSSTESKAQTESRFPFHFYRSIRNGMDSRRAGSIIAKLYQPCPVTIRVRQQLIPHHESVAADGEAVDEICRYIETEVLVVQENESSSNFIETNDDCAMIAGQTKRILSESEAVAVSGDDMVVEWQWCVVCVFLSEGHFQVAAVGRCLEDDYEGNQVARSHVWCHDPLRIHCVS